MSMITTLVDHNRDWIGKRIEIRRGRRPRSFDLRFRLPEVEILVESELIIRRRRDE